MKDHNTLSGKEKNIGKQERAISLIAGSFLLYKAFFGRNIALNSLGAGYLIFRGSTGYCPLYGVFNVDNTKAPDKVSVKTYLTVNKSLHEVYSFWRKLENLPLFMKHLHAVSKLDDKRSTWKANVPGGLGTIDWDAEIIADKANELITWKSLPGSQIENDGTVRFVDAGKFGTEVYVEISYRAPAGNIGAGIGKFFTPLLENMIKEDIKNFRRIIETDELPTIQGQASGNNN